MKIINNALEARTGFYIGIDFHYYGLKLSTKNNDVNSGYQSAIKNPPVKTKSTPVQRKWLNLRLHAYERGIHFSEEITPDTIDELNRGNKGFCPYTKIKMTKGALKNSDWSIDRICNEFGYVPVNISLMTTGLNAAKSDLNIEQVQQIINDGKTFKGISIDSWERLLKQMNIVHNLLYENDAVFCEIKELSRNKEDLLLFFIERIIEAEETRDKTIITAKVLSLIEPINESKKSKMVRFIRSVVIKWHRSNIKDLYKIIARSNKTMRELLKYSSMLDTNKLDSEMEHIHKQIQIEKNFANKTKRDR